MNLAARSSSRVLQRVLPSGDGCSVVTKTWASIAGSPRLGLPAVARPEPASRSAMKHGLRRSCAPKRSMMRRRRSAHMLPRTSRANGGEIFALRNCANCTSAKTGILPNNLSSFRFRLGRSAGGVFDAP